MNKFLLVALASAVLAALCATRQRPIASATQFEDKLVVVISGTNSA